MLLLTELRSPYLLGIRRGVNCPGTAEAVGEEWTDKQENEQDAMKSKQKCYGNLHVTPEESLTEVCDYHSKLGITMCFQNAHEKMIV